MSHWQRAYIEKDSSSAAVERFPDYVQPCGMTQCRWGRGMSRERAGGVKDLASGPGELPYSFRLLGSVAWTSIIDDIGEATVRGEGAPRWLLNSATMLTPKSEHAEGIDKLLRQPTSLRLLTLMSGEAHRASGGRGSRADRCDLGGAHAARVHQIMIHRWHYL